MEVTTEAAEETKKFGQDFGNRLKGGETLALVGDLGSGKTTFVQGLAKAFGVERVNSPTFILMRSYGSLYHLDLYRLEENVWEEVKNLGVEEIWRDPKNIVVIEWAEKISNHLPENTTWLYFESLGEDKRKITIK